MITSSVTKTSQKNLTSETSGSRGITAAPDALATSRQVVGAGALAADPVAGQLAVVVAAAGHRQIRACRDRTERGPFILIVIGMCDLHAVKPDARPVRR